MTIYRVCSISTFIIMISLCAWSLASLAQMESTAQQRQPVHPIDERGIENAWDIKTLKEDGRRTEQMLHNMEARMKAQDEKIQRQEIEMEKGKAGVYTLFFSLGALLTCLQVAQLVEIRKKKQQ